MSRAGDALCGNCLHPVDPHVLVTTVLDTVHEIPDVPVAGVMLCPDCDCVMTWSAQGYPEPELPPDRELDLLRERAPWR